MPVVAPLALVSIPPRVAEADACAVDALVALAVAAVAAGQAFAGVGEFGALDGEGVIEEQVDGDVDEGSPPEDGERGADVPLGDADEDECPPGDDERVSEEELGGVRFVSEVRGSGDDEEDTDEPVDEVHCVRDALYI